MPKTELADLVLYHPRTRPPCRCRPEVQQVFHEATLALKTRECCNESDQFAENRKERKAHKCIYITVITGFVLDSITHRCLGKEPALLPRGNVECTRVSGRNRVYHCPYNLSSNMSAMASCLLLQGLGYCLLRRRFYFSSRTLRDLHD